MSRRSDNRLVRIRVSNDKLGKFVSDVYLATEELMTLGQYANWITYGADFLMRPARTDNTEDTTRKFSTETTVVHLRGWVYDHMVSKKTLLKFEEDYA